MNQQNASDQEIDLGQLFKKIKEFGNYCLDKFFDFILFIKSNILILLILAIVGFVSGMYLSKAEKTFDQKIIVAPNFGSVDFLYDKIELLESKIGSRDSLFFKNIGVKNYTNIKKISVEPIIDVYKFANKNPRNFELIRFLAEKKSVEEVIKDRITSRNYPEHLILVETAKMIDSKDVLDPIFTFINESPFYSEIQKATVFNTKTKLAANDSTIAQIDRIISELSKKAINNSSDQLIYYNNNSNISDIIRRKDTILNEQAKLRKSLIIETDIIKKISVTTNTIELQKKNNNYKFILPAIFIGLFIILKIFISFYQSQIRKRNLN